MSAVIHIAGIHVHINDLLRQRCAWCGAVLADYDLTRVMVPTDQPGPPPTFPVGDLIAVDGNAKWVVDHRDGDQLPEGACARIDPEVTL